MISTPLVILAFVALVRGGAGPVDDDYIVYRYARNWLEQGQLAFNLTGPGSVPVDSEGYTSPLWLSLTAFAEWARIAPERFSPALGLMGWLAATFFTALFVAALGARSEGRGQRPVPGRLPALLAALLIALSPALAWHAHAGLGTVPLAGAVAAAMWAAATSRRAVFVGACVLAVGLRLEAAVALVPLAFLVRRSHGGGQGAAGTGRFPLLALVPAAAAVAVVMGRWVAFGRFFPATYHVKTLPLDVEVGYGAAYLIRAATEGGLSVLAFFAILGLSGTGAVRCLATASAAVLAAVIASGGDWVVYARFLVPFAPVFVAGAVLWGSGLSLRPARVVFALACLLVTVGGYRASVVGQALFERRFFEEHWLSVGEALAEQTAPDATVALSPIGAIGYVSGRPVIDILGLTHTAFIGREPDLDGVAVKGHHRHDGAWVLDQAPDYLLLGNATLQPETESLDVNPWEADIVGDPRFRRDYVPETFWIGSPDGSRRAVPYFRRRGGAPALRDAAAR